MLLNAHSTWLCFRFRGQCCPPLKCMCETLGGSGPGAPLLPPVSEAVCPGRVDQEPGDTPGHRRQPRETPPSPPSRPLAPVSPGPSHRRVFFSVPLCPRRVSSFVSVET